LSIYSQSSGTTVPLKQVADVELTFEPGIIERRDRERTMTLQVQLQWPITASEVNAELGPWLAETRKSWAPQYKYEMGGEAEESGEANASIAAKLPLALMLIVLLLVIQFNSIMLTTATTVLGMLPLWWGGTAMFEPLAISIIFGLLFATLLTLLVVPVLYATLFRVRFDGA
jgi:multidrug efflux pump subunit AcrB